MEWIKISAKRETNSGTGLPQKKKKNKQTRKEKKNKEDHSSHSCQRPCPGAGHQPGGKISKQNGRFDREKMPESPSLSFIHPSTPSLRAT